MQRAGDDAEGLTETEALAKAKKTGETVEIASLRGEASEVFATPNGDLEAREYLRPVWTRTGGAWKRIDTDLAVADTGTVMPKASTMDMEFSGGGEDPLVRMRRAGRELSLSWPTPLPKPEVEGAVATYPSVLPDVDLRMTAQEDGFTQLLVVKSAEAAANPELSELRLEMDTRGLSVQETADGGLQALDEGAEGAVFEAPKPMMWDSSPGDSPATAAQSRTTASGETAGNGASAAGAEEPDKEPAAGESGKLAPVEVEVPDGQGELVLTPDADVLKGENTAYPVFIDPQWHSPKATAWTMVSKYWANSPQWKFNGKSDSGMGFCNWDYCAPHDTKRLFYRISTSRFAGKSILSAEFVVRNTWSASCSARKVNLYKTKAISSSTTWNDQYDNGFWLKELASESFAYGYTGCAAKDAEFNVKSAVQDAADAKSSTMTFGLKADSESDPYGWKRFSDDAYLRVEYNRPPPQVKMSQLTMEYGGTCKKPSSAARVRTLGKIYANDVTDPDGDNISIQFQAKWDTGDGKGLIVRWNPARTSAKKSGSSFAISLPSSIPKDKQVHWYVRSHDGAQYSPWSTTGDPTACYFVLDTKVPKAPAISSGEYPASDPESPDDPWYDGVGKYGFFSIKAADTDVTKYWFGINSDPTSKNALTTTSGAEKTAAVLPSKPGLNFVTAQAFDAAGNGSEVRTYQFRVKAGQPERATWQFDEGAGAAQAEGRTPARSAALHGGVTAGIAGAKGTALEFNGTDGYAATDIPVLDTSGGFAVSAWVKLSRMPDSAAIIAAQPGNHSPGFELYYSKSLDRWVFNQYASDSPGAPIVRAMAEQPGGVTAGTWTHLVGSYSTSDDALQLYVDGKLVGQTVYSTPWDARRGLQIGAGSYSGVPGSFFPGTIDELQLFDKPLTASEVAKLRDHQPVGDPGRPAVAIFPLDEQAGATQVTGRGGVLPAIYNGGVTTGVPGVAGKSVRFNGTDAYAKIGQDSGAHINSSRSFTVSAWAKLDSKPTRAAIITAQAGKYSPGFELYYSAAYGRWAFNQYSSDSPDAVPVRALQPNGTVARTDEWVHLTGVHDTVADTLTLYVNGAFAGSTTLEGSFYADQSMYIGAGSYTGGALANHFPGTIDDVRLFDRPLSADEVSQVFQQRPLVAGRWTFQQASGSPLTTPDASATGNDMTLNGGATIGSGWVDGGVNLDGVDDYGVTSAVPVDTSTSFTITAWAQAAAVPEDGVALLNMPGTTQSAFTVRYEPSSTPDIDPGRWEIALAAADTSDASVSRINNSQFFSPTDWTHLALVYDGFGKYLSLYVNGELEEVACADTDGDGASDDSGCTDKLSWAEDVLTFKATQPMQLGRARTGAGTWGDYWPGTVSDVWAFQGALAADQVRLLALGLPGAPTDVPSGDF
ncbi:LamG-like jellyroll fold domain-containing protein [Streptomyces sp. NPDC090114]|uniref:LamG-like jellyroll fold domain-containing protein n=1 Tax=Streptomyces sp. NPDC090114 TaxID=3365950 RepID=UPI0038209D5C